MIILNFSHPLTPGQRVQIEALTGQTVATVLDRPAQFDPAGPFVPQTQALLDSTGLSPAEWQGVALLINPPGLSPITAILLAELHGRCGYFPPIIRLARIPDSMPPQFAVAEIINLQAIRDTARRKRGELWPRND